MWRRNYAEVYKNLSTISWPQNLKPLIDALQNAFRSRVFKLIAKAYSNISEKDLSVYLGLSAEQAKKSLYF